ncbi:MAG TPA: response regulator transcription factor [Bacteroidia bacterium]|jgi:DNA-binding response OmpR family regulator|nr:response regulator transcription factor [Bacteroidia bacterium]
METTKPKILYVEDDVNLGFVTSDNLKLKGYRVVYCKDGKSGLEAYNKEHFDICILDVMLPEMDGFTLSKLIRNKDKNIPIIFITAKTMKEDRIAGFKTGADDYITKPFSIEELLLRIEVFLKRSKVNTSDNEISTQFTIGNYKFNFADLSLERKKQKSQLTLKEAELLRYFCINKGKIIKREDILKNLWGDDDYFMGRSLDVFISRLRKYLSDDRSISIENIHGVGFRMDIAGK